MSKHTSDSPNTSPAPRRVDRSHRRALLHELDDRTRSLHVSVLSHTLAEGVPVNPSALAVVLSAHDDLANETLCFSAEHVTELVWCGIADFCDDYGLAMPDGCSEALHAVLAIGTATSAFSPRSDPSADLFSAFRELAAS